MAIHFDLLTTDDWAIFASQYPDATAFLIRTSLRHEVAYLRRQPQRNAWQEQRLRELEAVLPEETLHDAL